MGQIKPEDLLYTCNATGYWVLYKGKRLCGAGTIADYYKRQRKNGSNVRLYADEAKLAIRKILSGLVSPHMVERIRNIDEEMDRTNETLTKHILIEVE